LQYVIDIVFIGRDLHYETQHLSEQWSLTSFT